MNPKSEYLINLIFEKLKKYKNKEIFLEKENFVKFVPAPKDFEMEKDKGCKLTTADKIGEEKIYLLEK